MMEGMVRVVAVAVATAVLSTVLRRYIPELAFLLVLCAGIWMLRTVMGGLNAVLLLMEELVSLSGMSEVLLEPVLKTVALSILTRITAELCRGAGEGGIAAFVESAGTVFALVASLPLVRAVTQMMSEMLG